MAKVKVVAKPAKSHKGLIIGLVITAVIIVGGGFGANWWLKENLGIDLMQIFNLVKGSLSLSVDAKSVNDYTEEEIIEAIGEEKYGEIMEVKNITMSGLNDWAEVIQSPSLEQWEGYDGLKSQVAEVCGEKYSIYMYAIYSLPGVIEFKVFEWTIEVTDGAITKFEEGKTITYSNVTVIMEMDEDIATQVLTGGASTEQMIEWLTAATPKMRVRPVTELLKVQKLIPVIAPYM